MKKSYLILLLLLLLPFVNAGEYYGSFELDKTQVQLGDPFTLTAELSYENATAPEIARIYFRNGDISYKTVSLIINNQFGSTNELTFDANGEPLPEGTYQVDIVLEDNWGTLKEFNNVLTIEVKTELELELSLGEEQILPGEVINIIGRATKKISGDEVSAGTIKILLDGEDYQTSFSGNEFLYAITSQSNIESYYHNIDVTMQDDYGNKDTKSLSFYVIPQPATFEINTGKTDFFPEEELIIIPSVFDQAGAVMSEDIEVRMYTADKKREIKEIIISGEEIKYDISKYATPGEWRVKAKSESGLESEIFINIAEVNELSTSILNQTLLVKNLGNVKYRELLEINITSIDNFSTTFTKRTNLLPGEEITIDLMKELRSGNYTLLISNTNQDFNISINDDRDLLTRFGDFLVGVTGEVVRSKGSNPSMTSSYVLLLLFLAGAFTMSYRIRSYKKSKANNQLKNKQIVVRKKAPIAEEKKEDATLVDLKKRILRDIEEAKIKRKETSSFAIKPISAPTKVEARRPVESDARKQIEIMRELQRAKVEARNNAQEEQTRRTETKRESPKRIEFDRPLTQREDKVADFVPAEKPTVEESKEEKKGLFGMFD
jgi:hypothetical protein